MAAYRELGNVRGFYANTGSCTFVVHMNHVEVTWFQCNILLLLRVLGEDLYTTPRAMIKQQIGSSCYDFFQELIATYVNTRSCPVTILMKH